jgi:predicted AlkP superfamily pyrophosphatase or phosphodiesterase
MRRALTSARVPACCLVLLLLFGVLPQGANAAAYDAHPKLVVILVIDQFRGDYLDRYRADFKPNGFRLFQDKGAVFSDCYFDYANTTTAPGHATIGTGAYTDGHGIADNQWWDLVRNTKRPVSSVEDDRYFIVGDSATCAKKDCIGASPRNLMASTVGDELRLATEGQAKVFGISLKDRAAILTVGASANGAYWMDHVSGHFVTSSYYMAALPQWVQDFNAGDAPQTAALAAGVTAVTNFVDQVGGTPATNTYELAFAKALIQGEQLGKHSVTDMITISLSANDLAGHRFGPDSPQEKQMVDGIDSDLDGFFSWLDKYLDGGVGNAFITLTADHGVAPTPQVAKALGLPAANVDLNALIANLNDAINGKFSPGDKIAYVLPHQSLPYLSLDSSKFDRAGVNELEAEEAVRDAFPAALAKLAGAPAPPATSADAASATETAAAGTAAAGTATADTKPDADATVPATPHRDAAPPTLAHIYTRVQLAKGEYPVSEFGNLLAHSYARTGGWYVMAILEAFQMDGTDPTHTTHYSPYSYDRHVPLAFYGAPFAHGTYRTRVAPVDLAATLASLLGVNQPSSSVGRVLTQALHAPVYPSSEPKTMRKGTRAHPLKTDPKTDAGPDPAAPASPDSGKEAPAK